MNVLFVTNRLDVGGIETNIVRLTAELVGRGHRVTVASRPGALTPTMVGAGGRALDLEVRPRDLGAVRRDVRALRRVLREERPDVVHVFSAQAAGLLWPAAHLTRPRPVVVSSIMGLRNRPEEAAWRVWLRAYATTFGVDRLIVTAPAIGAAVDQLPIRARRVVRGAVVGVELPNPATAAERERARAALGVEPGVGVVLTIGRLEPSKSHELFIRAAAEAGGPAEARFFLVGGGACEAELRQVIAEHRLEARVTMLGERHDVTELLAATDVYVRPGVVEGFVGITVLEAQAMAVPVVSFETEDVKLAIEDGSSGVLVPPGDVGALARAVAALLADPTAAEAMGARGRDQVATTFALGPVVDDLLGNYEAVLGRSGNAAQRP